jgi:hypothetical protein
MITNFLISVQIASNSLPSLLLQSNRKKQGEAFKNTEECQHFVGIARSGGKQTVKQELF